MNEQDSQDISPIEPIKVTLMISGYGNLKQKKEAVRKMLYRCLPVGSNGTVFFIEQFEITGDLKG